MFMRKKPPDRSAKRFSIMSAYGAKKAARSSSPTESESSFVIIFLAAAKSPDLTVIKKYLRPAFFRGERLNVRRRIYVIMPLLEPHGKMRRAHLVTHRKLGVGHCFSPDEFDGIGQEQSFKRQESDVDRACGRVFYHVRFFVERPVEQINAFEFRVEIIKNFHIIRRL